MKKILLFFVSLLLLSACSSENVKEVSIYSMKDFSTVKENSKLVITNKEDIDLFVKAFDSAKKEPGIVDMAEPEYRVHLGEKTFFLWISENSGTIMNVDDTHIIYSLSKHDSKKINERLSGLQ